MSELQEIKNTLDYLSNDLTEIKKKVNILGHNQNEFAKISKLLIEVESSLYCYKIFKKLKFFDKIKILFLK